ncbi:MAG: extensin family protein [Methyloceanibacter sp.]
MNQAVSSRLSTVVSIVAVCGFGLLVVLTFPLWPSSATGWLEPVRGWLTGTWGTSLNPSPADRSTTLQPPAAAWTDKEIETALMECVQSLAAVAADLVPMAPMRIGDCGTPAPVLVRSIGSKDKVTFDPPLVLNCPMVAALYRWINESVQPAASKALGSPISKLVGSSYACRNVYNLPHGHPSQHAFANAVDLPMFVLADGRKIDVTHGWGPTQRDITAAAKAKKTSTALAKVVPGQQMAAAGDKVAAPEVVKVSTSATPSNTKPNDTATAPPADPETMAEAKFLRLTHEGGCKIFSTVLGPEANDVHRSHLHLDLQDRKSVDICE